MKAATIGLLAVLLVPLAAASSAPPAPDAGALPALATSLHERIRDVKVATPGGGSVALGEILDPERLERCLATIGQAGAWPSAWLVVQDRGRAFDLVLRVRLAEGGGIETPDTAFAATRVDWDDAALERAVREATGRKPPREKSRSLVVQSFSRSVVTTYVYDLPKTGKDAKGLMALLPEGSLLRESRAVDLGDGRRHTLAIVLIRPRFVPSACASAEDRSRGHVDVGGALLVLAGETALDATLDLTEDLKNEAGEAVVPRFACTDEDPEPSSAALPFEKRFGDRDPVRLLRVGGEGTGTVRASVLRRADGDPRGAIPVQIVSEAGSFRLVFADGV